MKLLLTSNGISNPSIAAALRQLLIKPTGESRLLFVPTAANGRNEDKTWLIQDMHRVMSLGWERMDVVDIATTDGIERELWFPSFAAADVIMFGGGNPFYLSHWLQRTGLDLELPALLESKIYVGASSGSIVCGTTLAPTDGWLPEYEIGPFGEQSSTQALGLFEGAFRAHYLDEYWPSLDGPTMQRLATQHSTNVYALDDESAMTVVDGEIEFVSEGTTGTFYP